MKKTAPKFLLLASAFCLGLLFAACSSTAVRMSPASEKNILSATNKVGAVSIELDSNSKEKLKDNLKFDQEKLRQLVEKALVGYGVFDAEHKAEIGSVHILITNIRVRSNFSAVMWGAMAGADIIEGQIFLKDAKGEVVDHLKVSSAYALGGLAGGQDSARMDWLYEAFVKEAMKLLTGQQK